MVVCLPLLTMLPLLLAVLVEKKLPGHHLLPDRLLHPGGRVGGRRRADLGVDRSTIAAWSTGWPRQLGVIAGPLPFLTDQWLLLFSAMSLTVWKGLGYYMIIYLAALGNVGRELHEAAAVDGADRVPPVLRRHRPRRPRHDGAGRRS